MTDFHIPTKYTYNLITNKYFLKSLNYFNKNC